MQKLLDTYLQRNGLNRNQLSKKSGIAPMTLQRSSDKDAFTINPRIYWGISCLTDKTPGKVFDEIIKMEMENDMTTDETVLLMNETFKDEKPFVSVEDMGDDQESLVVEFDLPSENTVRFAINHFENEAINSNDVLRDLAYAMDDYDHEEDGAYYPTWRDANERDTVVAEYIGLSQEDAQFLSELSDKF